MKCIFTGKEANSSEHVIPRWLQSRFNLSDQTLVIPNGTTLRSRKHHRVPADVDANNRFGAIEERISRGIFRSGRSLFVGAKIHIGCVYRDASLRLDIKDPSSPFVMDVSNFAHDVWLFQQMFENWSNGGTTDPRLLGASSSLIPESDTALRFHSLPHNRGRGYRYRREIHIGLSMGPRRCNACQHPRPVGAMACPTCESAGRYR